MCTQKPSEKFVDLKTGVENPDQTPLRFVCKNPEDGCACDSPKNPDDADCAQITRPRSSDFRKFCEVLHLGTHWQQDPNQPPDCLRVEELTGIGILRLDYAGDHAYGDTGSTMSYTSRYFI